MTVLSPSVAHEEWTRLSPAAALAVTARVVNSSLRLDDVLHTVVRLTCQVLDADRATILLFDQQQRLVPAASDGRVYDPESLARFREMPPVSSRVTGPLPRDAAGQRRRNPARARGAEPPAGRRDPGRRCIA